MFYTIYKITNNLNDKYYIGMHQTNDLDDDYMGSGKMIVRAIKKYGKDNFSKEILHIFDTEEEMIKKEAELVVVSENTYNLCDGGLGGWGYCNKIIWNEKRRKVHNKRVSPFNKEYNKKYKRFHMLGGEKGRKIVLEKRKNGEIPWAFTGKQHTEETKIKMRKSKNIGSCNSQFGTIWITDGSKNMKIKQDDIIPKGWYKGRKM